MILIIDDNLVYQEVICDFLAMAAIQTLSAFDGHRGLDLFKMYRADIEAICLDLQMPGLGGVETYQQLRLLDQAVPIIFCTANDLTWVQEFCKADNAVYFFEKSMGLKEFLAIVKRAISPLLTTMLPFAHTYAIG